MKETLADNVEDVIVNDRSVDSLRSHPMSEHGLPADMKRIAQQPSSSQQQRQSTLQERERKKGEKGRRKEKEREKEDEVNRRRKVEKKGSL